MEDHVVEHNSGLKTDKLCSVNGKELFKNSQNLVCTHTHTHTHSSVCIYILVETSH